MIYTKVFNDPGKYEKRYFGLVTARQSKYIFVAGVVSIILNFALEQYINIQIRSYILMVGAIPILALGFISYKGMDLMDFIYIYLKHMRGNEIYTIHEKEIIDEKKYKKKRNKKAKKEK